jgi:hypothetical protein
MEPEPVLFESDVRLTVPVPPTITVAPELIAIEPFPEAFGVVLKVKVMSSPAELDPERLTLPVLTTVKPSAAFAVSDSG